MNILVSAGLDPQGMSEFFERLQKASRFHENGALRICVRIPLHMNVSRISKTVRTPCHIDRFPTVLTFCWSARSCALDRKAARCSKVF